MPLNVIVLGLPNNNMKKIITTNHESLHHVIFWNFVLTAIYFLQHLYSTTVSLMPFPHSKRTRVYIHTKQQADLEFCITTYLNTYLQNKKPKIRNKLQALLFSFFREGQISALDRVQKKAAKFAHHKISPHWEILTSRRKLSRICALFKA
jgi:hypothetical protein